MVVGDKRHALAAFSPWERIGTHCLGGWVGPRAGLDHIHTYRIMYKI